MLFTIQICFCLQMIIKLCKIIFNEDDIVLLQKDLDSTFSWIILYSLLFHPNKCFTMHIHSKLNETITHHNEQ